jgi:hypothetical protein
MFLEFQHVLIICHITKTITSVYEVSGSEGGKYEDDCLLGWSVMAGQSITSSIWFPYLKPTSFVQRTHCFDDEGSKHL